MEFLTKVVNWMLADNKFLLCNNITSIILGIILIGTAAVVVSGFTKEKKLFKMFF